jgi:hypothetical protein
MSNFLLAAPIPPDGRLQVWNFDGTNTLKTRWKATADPNSPWTTPWTTFNPSPPGSPPALFFDMTAGVLPDGRTQIWGILDTDHKVYTSWKVSTDLHSLWSGWSEFDIAPMTPAGVQPEGISVSTLPDKRLQLFIEDSSANFDVWTSWKTTTDPKSPWTALKRL